MHDLILLNLSGRSSCCSRSLPVTPRSSVAQSQRPRFRKMTFTSLEFGSTRCFESCSINPESIRWHSFQVRGQWPDLDHIHILNLNGFFTLNLSHQFWPVTIGVIGTESLGKATFKSGWRMRMLHFRVQSWRLVVETPVHRGWFQPGVFSLCLLEAGAATSSPESQGETHTETFSREGPYVQSVRGDIFFAWPYSPVSVNWHLCHGYTIHTWYILYWLLYNPMLFRFTHRLQPGKSRRHRKCRCDTGRWKLPGSWGGDFPFVGVFTTFCGGKKGIFPEHGKVVWVYLILFVSGPSL